MKLAKPVKQVILADCAFRIEEEADGLIVHVMPIDEDADGRVTIRETRGACRSVFDMFGNLVGCKDVGACAKSCLLCTIYDGDGNDLGMACGCRSKCPDKPH